MRLLFLLSFLISFNVFASDYYGTGKMDTYDPATGLYFKTVERIENGNRSFLSSKQGNTAPLNIAVFDPSTQKSRLLFQNPPAGSISAVLFETGYKDGAVTFSDGSQYRGIKNNENVPKREPKSKVLVAVTTEEPKETVLLVADKKTGVLVTLTKVPATADWHLDVKNSKLRIVHQTGQTIQIESFDW